MTTKQQKRIKKYEENSKKDKLRDKNFHQK